MSDAFMRSSSMLARIKIRKQEFRRILDSAETGNILGLRMLVDHMKRRGHYWVRDSRGGVFRASAARLRLALAFHDRLIALAKEYKCNSDDLDVVFGILLEVQEILRAYPEYESAFVECVPDYSAFIESDDGTMELDRDGEDD